MTGGALAARLWSERNATLGDIGATGGPGENGPHTDGMHTSPDGRAPAPAVVAGCARLLLAHAWGSGDEDAAAGVDLSPQFRHAAAAWAARAAAVARSG